MRKRGAELRVWLLGRREETVDQDYFLELYIGQVPLPTGFLLPHAHLPLSSGVRGGTLVGTLGTSARGGRGVHDDCPVRGSFLGLRIKSSFIPSVMVALSLPVPHRIQGWGRG